MTLSVSSRDARFRFAVLACVGVSHIHQGRKLRDLLLAQALRDCYGACRIFAFIAVILGCIDDRTKSSYERWDFAELTGNPYRLFLSAATLAPRVEEYGFDASCHSRNSGNPGPFVA